MMASGVRLRCTVVSKPPLPVAEVGDWPDLRGSVDTDRDALRSRHPGEQDGPLRLADWRGGVNVVVVAAALKSRIELAQVAQEDFGVRNHLPLQLEGIGDEGKVHGMRCLCCESAKRGEEERSEHECGTNTGRSAAGIVCPQSEPVAGRQSGQPIPAGCRLEIASIPLGDNH